MARPRKTSSRPTAKRTTAVTGSNAQFVCPECGRTFARAAALGAHRRSHGVAGATAKRPPNVRAPRGRDVGRNGRTRTTADRDALLAALFPNGVPPRGDVIRAASGWLDEAERIAQMA